MSDRPILFSAPMVRAILEGRKTQTRRVLKKQPADILPMRGDYSGKGWITLTERKERVEDQHGEMIRCKYGIPDDRLWVRETWRITGWNESGDWQIEYKDGANKWFDSVEDVTEDQSVSWWEQCSDDCEKAGIPLGDDGNYRFTREYPCPTRWRPSIFMPRWASRIMLLIVNVRVERVQSISRDDAKAEGVSHVWHWTPERAPKHFERGVLNPFVANFSVLWDKINTEAGKRWEDNPWVWVIEFRKVAT